MVPMNRLLRQKNFFSVLASVAALSLSACGGDGSHSTTLPQAAALATAAPAPYTGPLADTMFTITIPLPKTGSDASRSPRYVSASTTQLRFTLISATASGLSTAGQINSFNTTNLGVKTITLGSAQCPGSGPWTCTLPLRLPPGTDNMKISAENSSAAVYAQQQQNFTVTAGIQNSLTTVLDANVATMALNTTSGFCAGTFTVANSGTVPTVGTQALTFNAAYKDSAGNTIPTNAPGRPVLKVNGHTDDNGTLGYSDPGNLNVKVTQSTQSFVLQKTDGTGTASVAVTIAPPNTNSSPNDGLVFTTTPGTTNFTFQAGPAPPSNFLAVIEQTGTNAGKVDLFTVSLGATDSFAPASPSTLAVQPPPVGSNYQNSDVDFPQDLLFDANGDLLIANGGGSVSGVDFGNFACIPAGAITTGANVATVLTTNMDDPAFLALGTDNTVALANVPGSAGVKVEEFELSGSYTPDSGTRNITNATYPGLGALGVIALPATSTNPSGSFASSITNGTTVSHIVIKRPDGTSTQIDNTHIVAPALAYDSFNDQIVAASNNGANSWLNFVNPTTFAVVKQFAMQDSGCYSAGAYTNCPPGGTATPTGVSSIKAFVTAASSSGYVAVAGGGQSGEPEVQVFNPSHNPTGGPIPYDATTTPGGATFVYGNATIIVNALRFITATKLLVSLQSDDGVHQGIYTYDVSTLAPSCSPCYDPNAKQYANSPKQTGFKALANSPLSAAYKP